MLISAKPSPKPAPDSTGEMISNLQTELSTLNVSHSTLLAQLNTVSKEVIELRPMNASLKDENEGWEFLVRERTLAGTAPGSLILVSHAEQNALGGSSMGTRNGQLEALDEEMEMDELHSDLQAQSPIFDDGEMHVRDLDEQESWSKRKSKRDHLAPPEPKGEDLGDSPPPDGGSNLAAELGRAEVDLDDKRMRSLRRSDESNGELYLAGEETIWLTIIAMRAEIRNLREANKALTLYCSKVGQIVQSNAGPGVDSVADNRQDHHAGGL